MKNLLLPLFLITSVRLFGQGGRGVDRPSPGSFHSDYKAPVFADSGRLKRMEAVFPLLEKIYREYAAKNNFPGLTFGVIVDGQLVYSGGFGYANVGRKTPATVNSLFRIASMTKSVTALAILKLRDEGRLGLEDPAYKYIPELKDMPALTADAPTITIRNLLAHSAGFPEDNPWGDRQLADPDEELTQLVKGGISFSNVPGVAYEYSNLGFALLGKVITRVSGKPYQQYITENILLPLGMTHTIWEYSLAPEDKLALGYRWLNGQWNDEPLLHDGSYGAMGGLITSIEDFSRYVAFHLSAWPPRNDDDMGPVKRSSIREMHQPHTFSDLNTGFKYPDGRACPVVDFYDYGLRWTKDCEGRVYVGHSGGLPGFGSQWRILPDYGIGVVAFANLTYAGLTPVNLAALDTLIALAGLQPRKLPASNILVRRQNELLQVLPDWKNSAGLELFAINFFKDNPLDSLQKSWGAAYAKIGKVLSIGELNPENQERAEFLIKGEKGDIHVFFTLTPENPSRIQQLNFRASIR